MNYDNSPNIIYEQRRKNPKEYSNILSFIFFGWAVDTFIKGYKRPLYEDDLYQVEKSQRSESLGDKLEREWLKELKKPHPSLTRSLCHVFGAQFVKLSIFQIYIEAVKISQPICLSYLLKYYEPNRPNDITTGYVYIYTSLIIMASVSWVLTVHNYVLSLQLLGMKIRVACCSLVYRKCLRLSLKSIGQTTVGQLVNLLSNDVTRFDNALMYLPYLIISPLQLPAVFYLMYRYAGISTFVGIGLVMAFVPLQIYIGKLYSVLRLRTAIRSDERVRLMNEIISGIQVIKMYTWERPFANLVSKARAAEMKHIKRTSLLKALILSYAVCTSRVATFITILTHTLCGNIPMAGYVFVVAAFFNHLRQVLTINLLQAIATYAEMIVSIHRLQMFLLYEEKEPNKAVLTEESTEQPNIKITNVSAKWSNSHHDNTLESIDFSVGNAKLVAIIGTVGSGKTSFLNVILKELPITEGNVEIHGVISYASQETWLFGGSVRQNILFGQDFDLTRYNTVVEACALRRDFCLLPHGDDTDIGERGTKLSGGQRARINLARAIYKEADIYLLDDPLSAVDIQVGKHIFEECILGFLKNKIIILATHQMQFLQITPTIIVLEKGHIVFKGDFKEFRKSTQLRASLQDETDDGENSNGDAHLSNPCDPENLKPPKSVEHIEEIHTGRITRKTYGAYFCAGNIFLSVTVICSFFLTQIFISGTDYFLQFWTNTEQNRRNRNNSLLLSRKNCVILYSVLIIFLVGIANSRSVLFFGLCMKASTKLHNSMLHKIIKAPMIFFNKVPSGQILNRFSKDMGLVDDQLPVVALDTLQIGLQVVGIILITIIVNPWLLIAIVVILVIFYLIRVVYLRTSRNLKRMEGRTRSPIFTLLNSSIQGLTTIRAFRFEKTLHKTFDDSQDLHSSAWFMLNTTSRAFGFWIDLICVMYIAIVAYGFIIIGNEQYGGNVGLALTQSLSLTGLFQWGMRQWSELENQMTSVERILEYTNLEQERESTKIVSPLWPEKGRIEFRNVSLRYSSLQPRVLRELNFIVEAKEKIGIVGRTGAGKSSIISALFQLAPTDGEILIDDVNIGLVDLYDIRSRISIIPQVPVLFSGSLRMNLDPFDEYEDFDLWAVLSEVELKEPMLNISSGLISIISEGGSNFSVGQRQLLCLARAIVQNNKILVLDEATANVDTRTDALIQDTIKRKFKECTVITIAHRLNTIMDSDKVLVMDGGKLAEFDYPFVLLQNHDGLFYNMVQQTGKSMAGTLYQIAQQKYEKTTL